MRLQRVFHIRRARLEDIDQIAVPAGKGIEHVVQLLSGGFGIQPEHSADNVVGSDLVSGVEVSRLRCRFEWSDENPCRIRAQIQALAIYESELGQ